MKLLLALVFATLSAFGQQATAQLPNPTDKRFATEYIESELADQGDKASSAAYSEFTLAIKYMSDSAKEADWPVAEGHLRKSIEAKATKTAYLWLIICLDLTGKLDEAKRAAQTALLLPDAGDKERSRKVSQSIKMVKALIDQSQAKK